MKSYDIVAPRVRGGKLPCLQDGLLWEVPVASGPSEGWGLWKVIGFEAAYVRPAAAWERERFLVGRPRVAVTLLEQLARATWSGVAPGRTRVTVHLVDQGAELDNVRAVHDGIRWWSLGLASGRTRKAQRLRSERTKLTDAQRLKKAVELAGGVLLGFTPTSMGFQVRWQRGSEAFVSLVDRDLNLQQAGFCLANTDAQHDLTSLVSLIDERPYYPEEGWS